MIKNFNEFVNENKKFSGEISVDKVLKKYSYMGKYLKPYKGQTAYYEIRVNPNKHKNQDPYNIFIITNDGKEFLFGTHPSDRAYMMMQQFESVNESKKSPAAKMVLQLMDSEEDANYQEALKKALAKFKDVDKAELEKELNKYI